jgi:hypothetical protein|tara:strand:- start:367 stop:684 length:318 start_codon:yes stop_codon:yes gene_type:complete
MDDNINMGNTFLIDKQYDKEMKYRLNILEERKKQNEKCCGGNGPKCKCSSHNDKKNSMVNFFESMSKNFINKSRTHTNDISHITFHNSINITQEDILSDLNEGRD